MKGSLNKGFLSYILLFLGLILASVLVLLMIMLLSPGTSILGYNYVSHKKVYKIQTYNGDDGSKYYNTDGELQSFATNPDYINFSDLTTLRIYTNYSSVKFRRGDISSINVKTTVKAFAKTVDYNGVEIKKYYNGDGVFEVHVDDQSYLWTLADGRLVDITLSNKDMSSLNIEVVTKNGTVAFSNDKAIADSNMIFGSINVVSENGSIIVSNDVNPNGGLTTLSLQTNSGNITVGDVTQLGVTTKVVLKAKAGVIQTGNIHVGYLTLIGSNTKVYTGDLTVLHGVDFQIQTGIVKLGNVIGNITDSQNIANNVKFDAGNIDGNITLPCLTDSDVTIGNVTGQIYIRTKAGSVDIGCAKALVDIVTEGGKITIKIDKGQIGDQDYKKGTTLKTKKGAINVEFVDVTDPCSITSEKGNVAIVYNQDDVFKLEVFAKRITFKNENSTVEDHAVGYPSLSNAEVSTTDIVTVTTEGNVQVQSKSA